MACKETSTGYTLIEVLIALAILSLSLAVLLSSISRGLEAARLGRSELGAAALAQSLLDSVGTSLPLAAREGVEEDGYNWRIEVEPYGTSEDRVAWGLEPRKVTVVVAWGEGDARREVRLATLRLPNEEVSSEEAP